MLAYMFKSIVMFLGEAEVVFSDQKVVLAIILWAGLLMYQGMLYYFDYVESVFVFVY